MNYLKECVCKVRVRGSEFILLSASCLQLFLRLGLICCAQQPGASCRIQNPQLNAAALEEP